MRKWLVEEISLLADARWISSDAISINGKLSICFWVQSSCYGYSNTVPNGAEEIKTFFEAEKRKCVVDFHCFCNQGLKHTWAGSDRTSIDVVIPSIRLYAKELLAALRIDVPSGVDLNLLQSYPITLP